MIHALASGSLLRDPETKIAKNGNPYLSVVVKCVDGNSVSFVRSLIFSESAQSEIADMHAGDVVAVVGRLEASTYEKKNGETAIGFSIVADRAVALKKEKREREKTQRAERKQEHSTSEGPNDSIPF